eukprot:g12428.t1
MARGLVVPGVVTKTTAAGWLTSQPAPRFHFQPLPIVAYGVRTSKTFRLSKESMRRAAVHARRQEERTGFLLDTKKCLQMELKRNTGIGWTRSLKILKHLECHVRTKGPPCNQAFREKVAKIAWQLKQQGPTRP